jgi:hypothetical protein
VTQPDDASDTAAHELELQEPDFSLDDCIEEAHGFLESAQSEVAGHTDPAVVDLMQACAWLLAGLEAMRDSMSARAPVPAPAPVVSPS